jgi:hypothetical protein
MAGQPLPSPAIVRYSVGTMANVPVQWEKDYSNIWRSPRVVVPLFTRLHVSHAKWLAPRIGVQAQEVKEAFASPGRGRSVWYETAIDDNWMAAYRLTQQSGHVVVSELRVFPLEVHRARTDTASAGLWSAVVLADKALAPKGGLTARVLRKVRIGEHATKADESLEGWRRMGLLDLSTGLGGTKRKMNQSQPTRGRPGHPPLFYARIAKTYAEALARKSTRPTEVVAARHQLTPSHARDLIHKARVGGFLTGTIKGRSAGALTPKSQAVLDGVGRSKLKKRRTGR